jgi:hypothetical protein
MLDRSLELATQAGDKMTMSEALRHLGIAGVAANLIGLGYIAAAQGRHDDALAILAQAASLATASGAHRILRSVEEAQAALAV